MKGLTGKQIKFIINIVSLAIFIVSYFYIYRGIENKTTAAYQEINKTENAISKAEEAKEKEAILTQNTAKIKAELEEILDQYPADIKKVDNLLFAQQLEKELNITFTSVQPTDSEPFFTTALPVRNADGTEITESEPAASAEEQTNEDSAAAPATMLGLQSTIALNFQTSYEGLKKMLEYINHYPDKTVIDSLSVSSDISSDLLTGTIVLKRFALSGSGKLYEPPLIDGISIGTDNIFKTTSGMN